MKSTPCPRCGKWVALYARQGALFQVLATHKGEDGKWCRWVQPEVKQVQFNQQEGKQ